MDQKSEEPRPFAALIRILLLLLLLAAGVARGAEVRLYGAASLAMGGAHVAVTDGADSIWSNPAGLGVLPGWELSLPLLGGGLQQYNGLLDAAEELRELLDNGERFGQLSQQEKTRVAALLEALGQAPAGASAGGNFALSAKLRNFGFGVLVRASSGVDLALDAEHLNPDNPRAADALERNTSSLMGASLGTAELRLGWAHSLLAQSTRHQLYAGGALRVIRGATAGFRTTLQELGDDEASFRPNLGTTSDPEWGVDLDLGLLYALGTVVRAGLVFRGLLDPDFAVQPEDPNYEGPDALSLGRQVRLGVALTPGWGLRVAADVDLTTNRTELSRVDDRQLGVGLEKWFGSRLALRAGFLDNLAAPTGLTLTSGVRWRSLDLTLAWSPEDGFLSSDQLAAAVSFRIDRLVYPESYGLR